MSIVYLDVVATPAPVVVDVAIDDSPVFVDVVAVTGLPGPQGPKGDTGPGGTKIWSGTAAPTAGIGADGDFYIQMGQRMYGPKSGAAIGLPVMGTGPLIPPVSYVQSSAITIGQEFQFNSAGRILALRFYRVASNVTNTRALKLWTGAGVLVVSIATAETAGVGGWLEYTLPTPRAVTAGQSYVVSYDESVGDSYGYETNTPPPVSVHISCGVARYSSGGWGFPTNARSDKHYADVVFEPPGVVWPVALISAPSLRETIEAAAPTPA